MNITDNEIKEPDPDAAEISTAILDIIAYHKKSPNAGWKYITVEEHFLSYLIGWAQSAATHGNPAPLRLIHEAALSFELRTGPKKERQVPSEA